MPYLDELIMKMYYIFDYLPGIYPNWTQLSSSAPTDKKFNLVIGGLAAHVVRLEREGCPQFELRLKSHLDLLKQVIFDSRKWQLKGVVSTHLCNIFNNGTKFVTS